MTLPGRHFRWRIRGNPLSWLDAMPTVRPGLILATSMVDLATLRGLQPRLAGIPACLYFHENQFAYPVGEGQSSCLEPQMVQLYAGLSAQRLVFNSAFNRDSFFEGVDKLLSDLPDAVPKGVVERLAEKSLVLPVPIRPVSVTSPKDDRLIVWNHRWEYDKAPEVFFAVVERLAAAGVSFRLALLGRRPARVPAALQQLRERFGGCVVEDGYLPPDAYRATLGRAAIVVSTALHEFQGLSVMEAVSAGCTPLVPDALCYREQYAQAYRYPAGNVAVLAERLRLWITAGRPATPSVAPWTHASLLPDWQRLLYDLHQRA
jgi:glycosyltransferase involved in cell wall biosynthesis